MKYAHLVTHISHVTLLPEETVREILFALPDALMTLDPGDLVRTPLGVFTMKVRKARTVETPTTKEACQVTAQRIAKLSPGGRLRRDLPK